MTPDPHIAELEARLAMKDEALDSIWAAVGDRLCAGKPLSKSYGQGVLKDVKRAQEASAATVAAFIQRVEQRGAAKELRRMAGQCGRQFTGTRRYSTPDLLARAAELERP